MNTGQRGIYIWLMLLGVAIGIVVLAGAIGATPLSAELAIAMLIAYLGMTVVALGGNRVRNLPKPSLRIAAARATPAARRAAQRARSRPEYNSDHIVTDVGLIVNQRRGGHWDRRLAQSVSLDEGAIQPYLAIDVPPQLAHRLALIRFEVYDQAGRPQFSHQIEQWVRDGENNIISDRQLPLAGNEALGRSGIWDMRVTIDGALVAIHSFSVTPSTEERRRQYSNDGEAMSERIEVVDEDVPVSLDELLREQRGRGEQ